MPDNVLAMIMAGGEGTRLHPLTRDRAKPAVPFGGKYRIVDFALSNMVNSGIVQIFVPLCLLLALWFLMGSKRQDSNALVALAFAAVLQVMALTFYIMHDRR